MLLFEKDVLNVKVKTSEIHIDKLKKREGRKVLCRQCKKKKKKVVEEPLDLFLSSKLH